MFSKQLSLSLLLAPIAIAAPLPTSWVAPVKRAIDIPGAIAGNQHSYIVAIKDNTVDPQGRGEWLNSILSTNGHTRRDLASDGLKLGWNETVFNGLAGTFNDREIRTLSRQAEVKYIQQGDYLSEQALHELILSL
jgi:cerevisin